MIIPSTEIEYPHLAETERLSLEPLSGIHVTDWIRFMEDEEAIKFFPIYIADEAEKNAAEWFERQLERYDHGMYGMHSIIEKSTGEFVGQCGLLLQEIDGEKELEIGYSLLRDYWGKGYATEAASHFRDFAIEHRLAPSVVSIIHPENQASRNVAERMGMKEDGHSLWKGLQTIVYRLNIPNSGP